MCRKFILVSVLSIVTILMGGCTQVNNHYDDSSNYKELEIKAGIVKDISGLKQLELKNGVGDIEIKTTNSSELRIDVKKSVRISSENKAKGLLDIVDIKTFESGDKISIKAVHIDNEKKDIWKLKSDKYPSSNLKINYSIQVPDNINKKIIETGVGNVSLTEDKGVFDIKAGVGNIYAKDIIPMKSSNFSSGTGSAEIKFSDLKESDVTNIDCGTGDIKIFIPKDAKCTIEKEAFMKDKTTEVINGGGKLIQVKASMGDVEIERQ